MSGNPLEGVATCDEHRRANELPMLSQAEKEETECGTECPAADTCKLRSRCRALDAAFGESEWG